MLRVRFIAEMGDGTVEGKGAESVASQLWTFNLKSYEEYSMLMRLL